MNAQELEKLSDDDLFDEIRDVVNYIRNNVLLGSSARPFRQRCRAIGAEMKRRGWQKEQTPHYTLFQMPES